MTHHTYRIRWQFDVEAESPVEAAQAALDRMLEFGHEPVGGDNRPLLTVIQFVDTDKPGRAIIVDTLDWTTGDEWLEERRVR